jgi:Rieske Fe-S protein
MTHPEGPSTPGPTRRTVLASVGLAGVAVTAVAGCGAGGHAANSAVGSAKGAAPGAVQAISKATIPVGGGKVFDDQKVVVTQPAAGDFKAFSAICTHQACLVSSVSDGTINCACHGSRFDITTGAVRNGPATQALPEKKVSIGTDGITVA